MEKLEIDKASEHFHSIYDFIFIGLGAANCLLILRLHDRNLLIGKTIAIVEPDSKTTNDRTFCFWATKDEVTKLNLDKLVSYSWENIEIGNIIKEKILPLHYFHIKGIDLYNESKRVLGKYSVTSHASHLTKNPRVYSDYFEIKIGEESVFAHKVFDSRPPKFAKPQRNQSHLLQSFYGWKIKTTAKVFDRSTVTMMDFSVPQNNFSQFVYLLPFTENSALVELTRFGEEKLTEVEAKLILDNYIQKFSDDFEILEFEQGVIPMSSANLQVDHFGKNWINMGSRANLLKCTTGYAFHAMAEDAVLIAESIKNGTSEVRKTKKKRFEFYDRLLLKILQEKPAFGKTIFETLFRKLPMVKVLHFLREKTSVSEEILIFSKLPKRLFIKSAITDMMQGIPKLPVVIFPFLFTVLAVLFSLILPLKSVDYISLSIIGIGFFTFGLSHGALDHLIGSKISNKKELFYFAVSYLLQGAILGLVWIFLPSIALLLFLGYSMWHFGQADFKEWKLKQGWQSFFWGFTVLITLLLFHLKETIWVLSQIPNLNYNNALNNITEIQLLVFQIFIISCGLFLAIIQKSKYMFLTLTYVLISSILPLLVSFGIYFVGQHSLHGWRHLLSGLKEQSVSLWLKSLPFSIGGALIILSFIFLAGQRQTGLFFVILSCLSIPHVIRMHRFYSKLS